MFEVDLEPTLSFYFGWKLEKQIDGVLLRAWFIFLSVNIARTWLEDGEKEIGGEKWGGDKIMSNMETQPGPGF